MPESDLYRHEAWPTYHLRAVTNSNLDRIGRPCQLPVESPCPYQMICPGLVADDLSGFGKSPKPGDLGPMPTSIAMPRRESS